jgi:hypothetical protein
VVEHIIIKPSNFSAHLFWKAVPAGYNTSINITHFLIYLNGKLLQKLSQEEHGRQFIIEGIKPYTMYTVGIEAQDYYLVKSRRTSKTFNTKEAGKHV